MFATHFDVRIGQISGLKNSLLCFIKTSTPHYLPHPAACSQLEERATLMGSTNYSIILYTGVQMA
jgi:hypothetical protein